MCQPWYEHCSHFKRSLPRKEANDTIQKFIYLLEQNGIEFDTFAFTGLSGALIAPTVAFLMDKELLLIRKNEGKDNSNSTRYVEGNMGAENIVVVDDLICTGKTMGNLLRGINRFIPTAKVVGLLLYADIGDERELFLPGSPRFQAMLRTAPEIRWGGSDAVPAS